MVVRIALLLGLLFGSMAFPLLAQQTDPLIRAADSLFEQNNYSSAINGYLSVIQIADRQQKPDIKARAMLSVAKSYYHLYDRPSALKWLYRTHQVVDQQHIEALRSEAYYLTGAIYIEEEVVDSAEKYAFKAIDLMKRENDHGKLAKTYCTLVELYLNTSKDTSSIERSLSLADRHAQLSGDDGVMAFVETKRYNYNFFLLKDHNQALQHIHVAESLYRQTGNREAILNAIRAKAECLIMLGDTSARAYMNAWFQFKDSVLQAEKARELAQFETVYETELREQENKLLKQKNKLMDQEVRTQSITILLLILVLAISVVIGLLWLIRVKLAKSQQALTLLEQQQAEKERIARDLHDNVGGQLSYIIHSLENAAETNVSLTGSDIGNLTDTARSVMRNLRETIWAISDPNLTANGLSDRLKLYARSLFRNTNVKVSFTEQLEANVQLSSLIGLNLYRMCQEILTNTFKHAKATEVGITLELIAQELVVTIADNGVGFNTKQEQEGQGLRNIRKRANDTEIQLRIESSAGAGTEFKLIVQMH